MSEIKCKQVGLNMIVVIDGQKYSKKCTKEEIESIKNKVLLHNKRPSKAKAEEIRKLVDKTIEAKETKKAKEKGIKKSIKKTQKKASKSRVAKSKNEDLVTKVETEFKEGNLTSEEIDRLTDMLRKKKIAMASEPKPEVKQQDSNGGGSRERYR